MDVYQRLNEARNFILRKCTFDPQVGIVLGSGLGALAEKVKVTASFDFSEIPHYAPPTVDGHGGRLVLGDLNGVPVACQQGRIHFYEGHSMAAVVHPVRVLGALGVKTLILTNAAGGLQEGMKPGDLMLITDHINWMGTNPLIGANVKELGSRFPDMTRVYSEDLRNRLKEVARKNQIALKEGVYCGLTGPTYETPAEIRMIRKLGGDAVGMSTVPEAIAARHMGLSTVGISCITNLAAGISSSELSHSEVTETGKKVEQTFTKLLTEFVGSLA